MPGRRTWEPTSRSAQRIALEPGEDRGRGSVTAPQVTGHGSRVSRVSLRRAGHIRAESGSPARPVQALLGRRASYNGTGALRPARLRRRSALAVVAGL